MEIEELKKALVDQAFLMWHVDTFGIRVYDRPNKEHTKYFNMFIADGPLVSTYTNKAYYHFDTGAELYWL